MTDSAGRGTALSPAVFLDRDGVINRKAPEPDYITHLEAFEVLPGAAAAIARLAGSEYQVVVVTNQRGVARGLVPASELRRMHDHLVAEVEWLGGGIDGIYVCPHDKDDACGCRKPAPGLLLDAAADLRIDVARSWMVGDREHDIVAGRRAGCRGTVHVSSPGAEALDGWEIRPDFTVGDLASAVEVILAHRS